MMATNDGGLHRSGEPARIVEEGLCTVQTPYKYYSVSVGTARPARFKPVYDTKISMFRTNTCVTLGHRFLFGLGVCTVQTPLLLDLVRLEYSSPRKCLHELNMPASEHRLRKLQPCTPTAIHYQQDLQGAIQEHFYGE